MRSRLAASQVKFTPCVLAAIISVLCVANAKGSPITYTEFATVTGSLAGTSFPANEVLTLTGTGDTANITQAQNVFRNILTTASFTLSVSVGGVGSGTFTDAIQVAVNQSGSGSVVAFGDNGVGDILDTFNAAFATYALSFIGPITGTSGFNSLPFPTTAGALILNTAGDATFCASTGGSSCAVPLPDALPLFATGLAGLGLLGWRRKKKAAHLNA
jgi:hypothetical protein